MAKLMRCPWCGLLQDEPAGVKVCGRCGGALEYEEALPPGQGSSCLEVQMELDQVTAKANLNVERYLLITLRTPAEIPPEERAPAGKQRPGIGFTSVLDVSGSMRGDKINQAKQAVHQAAKFLHDGDVFSLVTFADKVSAQIDPLVVDRNLQAAVEDKLLAIIAGGQTALGGGLEMGIEKALHARRDTGLILLLSDGQANVGETDLEKVGQRALQAREQGLIVSTLGVGLDYNEALMAEIATQGGGRFYHVSSANQIPAYLAGELGEAAALAARDVVIELELPGGATLSSLSAAYPVRQLGERAVVSVGDIPADTQLEIVLRLALTVQAPGTRLSVQGKLNFRTPAGREIQIPVNRVTVRFVEQEIYRPRQDVILPVAQRVFAQMKATDMLSLSRLRASRPERAEQQTQSIMDRLRDYADLLGEEQAQLELNEVRSQFAHAAASPAAAKQAINDAFRTLRSTKDHK
jgi:Ca-activated chloride channel family protein